MTGLIHSTESFGTLDGPGIRYVVFMKGCPLRCKFCHNPDTWATDGGLTVTTDELIAEYEKKRAFYKNGGITASGGEPLLQIDFVTELFKKAKERGIHTCLDTSGATFSRDAVDKFDALTEVTDLVMLDIKHIDPAHHRELTGFSNENIIFFAKYLDERNVPLWIRTVVIEGITDNPEHLFSLGEFIGKLKNLKALDVLPYHTLGVSKYKELGVPYPLEGIPPLSKEKAKAAKEIILRGVAKSRK